MLKEFKEFMVMGASPSLKNNNNSPHPMLTGKGDNKKKKGRSVSSRKKNFFNRKKEFKTFSPCSLFRCEERHNLNFLLLERFRI